MESEQRTPAPQTAVPGAAAAAQWLGRLTHWLGGKGPQARYTQYLLLLGALGLLILSSGSWFGSAARQPAGPATVVSAPSGANAAEVGGQYELSAMEIRMARDLEAILSQVAGAGRVQATVTLDTGPVQVLATDAKRQSRTIQERDSGGGTRTTTDEDESTQTVVMRSGSGDTPMVLRRERPQVAGVLVVAAGAGNAGVRTALTQAAAASLGIFPHRITVLPMGGK